MWNYYSQMHFIALLICHCAMCRYAFTRATPTLSVQEKLQTALAGDITKPMLLLKLFKTTVAPPGSVEFFKMMSKCIKTLNLLTQQ